MITRLVGGLFLIKGISGLATAFRLFDDIYPTSIGANVWDFLTMLATEIGPTVVFIFLSSKKASTPNDQETPDGDFEKEKELTTYDK